MIPFLTTLSDKRSCYVCPWLLLKLKIHESTCFWKHCSCCGVPGELRCSPDSFRSLRKTYWCHPSCWSLGNPAASAQVVLQNTWQSSACVWIYPLPPCSIFLYLFLHSFSVSLFVRSSFFGSNSFISFLSRILSLSQLVLLFSLFFLDILSKTSFVPCKFGEDATSAFIKHHSALDLSFTKIVKEITHLPEKHLLLNELRDILPNAHNICNFSKHAHTFQPNTSILNKKRRQQATSITSPSRSMALWTLPSALHWSGKGARRCCLAAKANPSVSNTCAIPALQNFHLPTVTSGCEYSSSWYRYSSNETNEQQLCVSKSSS